jgi:hypothetical protein
MRQWKAERTTWSGQGSGDVEVCLSISQSFCSHMIAHGNNPLCSYNKRSPKAHAKLIITELQENGK